MPLFPGDFNKAGAVMAGMRLQVAEGIEGIQIIAYEELSLFG